MNIWDKYYKYLVNLFIFILEVFVVIYKNYEKVGWFLGGYLDIV